MATFFSRHLSLSLLALTTAGLALGLGNAAQAESNRMLLNPCPGLYYEEPFNQRFLSPEGCPENAARQAVNASRTVGDRAEIPQITGNATGGGLMTPPTSTGTNNTTEPPLPETRDLRLASVTPVNQEVSIQLTNRTGAAVTYEVIGQTDRRALAGGESVMLTGIPLPSTITMVRDDSGLMDFKATSRETGMLEVTMNSDPSFDDIQGVLRIQRDGGVYIN